MIEFHRKLLADQGRNEAFVLALKRVIKPETTVVDIGSGTGFLSFMASKIGAKKCFLYESSPDLLALSKKIAHENGIQNCQFIAGHSVEVKNPQKADVIVSETLGNYAYEENIIETLNDAAQRYLKPGGIIIPAKVEQFVAPVIAPRIFEEINIWDRISPNLNFAPAKEVGLNNMYVFALAPGELYAGHDAVQKWDEVDLAPSNGSASDGSGASKAASTKAQNKSVRTGRVQWSFEASTTVYGFCVWWNCTLVKGAPGDITLSTSPFAPPTHWEQIFLPLPAPLLAAPNDQLFIELKSDSRFEVGIRLQWKGKLTSPEGIAKGEFAMDTEKGLVG